MRWGRDPLLIDFRQVFKTLYTQIAMDSTFVFLST